MGQSVLWQFLAPAWSSLQALSLLASLLVSLRSSCLVPACSPLCKSLDKMVPTSPDKPREVLGDIEALRRSNRRLLAEREHMIARIKDLEGQVAQKEDEVELILGQLLEEEDKLRRLRRAMQAYIQDVRFRLAIMRTPLPDAHLAFLDR